MSGVPSPLESIEAVLNHCYSVAETAVKSLPLVVLESHSSAWTKGFREYLAELALDVRRPLPPHR